jgi:hypothetical protein
MVRAYIFGHICRDIANENLCPDIDALRLSRKNCPIHNPIRPSPIRRRSSLSKPPMVQRDESTYEDIHEEGKPKDIWKSTPQTNSAGQQERHEAKPTESDPSKGPEKQYYHIFRNSNGEADWRKHVRVEKAMKQMLFGDARVSAQVVLEQTQRIGTSERNLVPDREIMGIAMSTDDEADELRSALAAAHIKPQTHAHTDDLGKPSRDVEEQNIKLGRIKVAEAESAAHDHHDCALYSEGESEDENPGDGLHDTRSRINSTAKSHRCNSGSDCSSCADEPISQVDSRDFAPEEPPQRWMDRSRAC